ncbi:unnamed protein product [Meloidogyne enterolobii]|uniref:Uncharacterized protein n=1 Tax=Meloidogyne enterolobii TaxID=390850 RepID=A0ACB0XMU4_MELEN
MNSTIFLCFIFLIVLVFLAGGQEEANSNHIYREEYETYETLQRHKIPPPQTFEFAETEFTRPSYYLSVPFRSQNKLQTIPDDIFSQLIRQHIARNRGSDQEGTLTKELPYYVTYNPQTNTYQISNQPPLLNTGMESEKTAKPNQQNSTSRKESHKPSTVSEKLKEPPLLIVLQKALPLDKNTQEEHKTISQNILGKQLNIPNAKQILFLDDYEESMNEDDYKENDGN